MSEQAGNGGADRSGGHHNDRPDSGMSTVTSVSGFLAGFSLAAVVVIADDAGDFRWPGAAAPALTIASVVLIAAAQASREVPTTTTCIPATRRRVTRTATSGVPGYGRCTRRASLRSLPAWGRPWRRVMAWAGSRPCGGWRLVSRSSQRLVR